MVNLVLLPALLTFTTLVDKGLACVPQSIPLDQKLQLIADANDHNHDGVTDIHDVIYDLFHNYDTDGDHAITENEWVNHWTCTFGDTVYVARFFFNLIGHGKAEMRRTDFTGEPLASGIDRSKFIGFDRQLYELFQQYQCVNKALTLDQKLTWILKDNNPNNDSVVDYSDIAYDVNTRYDLNRDGTVTQEEWVVHWSCRYGDTVAYARYVFGVFSNGRPSIKAADFNVPPFRTPGVPVANFKEMNRQRYSSFEGAVVGK